MKKDITRRDFLKLAGVLPLSLATPKIVNSLGAMKQGNQSQNVLIIVFDTLSAYNMSLYGYQRETTPNLARLASRSVVYHNHYAGGSFTTPGTASLLTGVLPWTHRAFTFNDSVDDVFVHKNVFSAFQKHFRFAYSHNSLPYVFFNQFIDNLDNLVPLKQFFLTSDGYIPELFASDADTATVSWTRAIKKQDEGFAYSLFLAYLYERYRNSQIKHLRNEFPRGIPKDGVGNYFLLEDAINWLGNELSNLPQPFLGYFHLLPPHAPYRAHRYFYGHFESDDWIPTYKPIDVFSPEGDRSSNKLERSRRSYDEFILNVDMEFKRLYDYLEASGLLDNTWVILTSDHGEMFERGIRGHLSPVLYEPLVRIPLVIFEPGRKERKDIYTSTSAVDLLPTLLYLTGQQQLSGIEGEILPPYNEIQKTERSLYVIEAKHNKKYAPFSNATVTLKIGDYKLMYFFGYEELRGKERLELYDLKNDPEELNDLSISKRETTAQMLNEIKQKLAEVNEPYS